MLETLTELLSQAGTRAPGKLAHDIQLLYDGALLGSKIERSTAPISRARRLAADLVYK